MVPMPALAGLPLPGSETLALLAALLVLLLVGTLLAGHRRREMYWQYDLEKRELESTQIEPGSSDDLNLRLNLDLDHQIHPDDLQLVTARLKQYLRGETPMFLSEHRIKGEDGDWLWMRARGRAVGVYRVWRDIGYAVGAVAGGFVADAAGLDAALWMAAVLSAAAGLLVAARMPETHVPGGPRTGGPAQLLPSRKPGP